MKHKLHDALKAISGHKIPEIPHEILMLEKELKTKFPNLLEMAKIIEQNTSLSGQVIQLINSPVMKLSLKEPITSIRDAVNVLGTDNIYNLIIATAIKDLFNDTELQNDIMNNSVDVAFCMADLSEFVQGITRDEAYMLGLFHNTGALMLAGINPEAYEKIYSNGLSNPNSLLSKEEATFNTNHVYVGVLITKKWHLPLEMINAVMLHHNQTCESIKSDKVRAMVAMLKIANAIVAEISLGAYCGNETKQAEKNAIQELMLDPEDVKEIRIALMSYSHKSESF